MTTDTNFNIVIGVYDMYNVLENSANKIGGYKIQLYLNNSGGNLSNASISTNENYTVSGYAYFNNIQIQTPGTYSLFVTSNEPDIINSVTNTMNFVIKTALKSIKLSINIENPTRYFNFTLNITLLRDQSIPITEEVFLNIDINSDVSYKGDITASTSTGTILLNIYYETTGEKSISVTYGGLTQSLIFTVYPELLVIGFADEKNVRFI